MHKPGHGIEHVAQHRACYHDDDDALHRHAVPTTGIEIVMKGGCQSGQIWD